MYLPGTIGDLIGDLRKNMDLNQSWHIGIEVEPYRERRNEEHQL